ncbi:hypothetical protein AB205_0192130 [Aquarana catesbeiana]|uniref:Secreted protein n=1 Tax=Aquarana catesbeiana TaxID=8400 RepID=A0A2G9QEZ7_AQUCT|nr:hypothetical protein AB205_0192130 [Aquarana catesbeiana]
MTMRWRYCALLTIVSSLFAGHRTEPDQRTGPADRPAHPETRRHGVLPAEGGARWRKPRGRTGGDSDTSLQIAAMGPDGEGDGLHPDEHAGEAEVGVGGDPERHNQTRFLQRA